MHRLVDNGITMCKPPYDEAELRKRFHEMKDDAFWEIVPQVHDVTQLTMEPLWSLYEAVRYIVNRDIPGDFVECGVLYGGAMMLMIKTLQSLGVDDRRLWLFDSFEGFVGEHADDDITWYGDDVAGRLNNFMSIVAEHIDSTGYSWSNVFLRKGDIEVLAPNNEVEQIALLRLDTDTYFSTKAELEHFYPKLSPGGVLIIDDYGHAFGARRAVDEYFAKPGRQVLLHRVNFTNRIAIKT